MILTAVDMVRRKGHDLDDHTIREELEGNICRCTGYHNIVKAIAAGARAMRGQGEASKAAE
jgi:carbon-monoxide dehydrogenase small subunit